ncbi:L-alanine-DL-glutamate epimerase-like enolase superfamily enzyme [Caldalkalibacillus uzonensis]|uniref:L-alanine-DL-glutamate epimerase-like enolase superfamily enzyme n=1 Tax=Caldalkalibacillus uzonensis TaxID=353224 RepID=A0ABU0CNX8_9BACI|nr:mandelate racemase/muconate lactonizing enzyme family protein [Caldalkalibacillus uzonensis]MDQ0338109.1 L-alanine-DL-glutamate epimerase-like enolase superfamily enzyme [Caldalkalibacillus uzonensis]
MRITKIETLQLKEHPRELWVQIHTDEGIVGLGETNAKPAPVQELIHSLCAELLLGQDPRNIDHIWHTFYRVFNHHGSSGAEMRALSAIDIALWDILGKVLGQPVYRLLGGASREKIKVYNTCVGYMRYNDRDRFLKEPEKLAEELLKKGISVMKIWPFDELSRDFQGNYISPKLIEKGIEPFRKIRKAFGNEIELALEGHGRWNLTSAIRIAKALEEYKLLWLEDLMPVNNVKTIVKLKESTTIPIAASERLFTRYEYNDLLQEPAADIVIADPAWAGGISEVKKIASLADIAGLPFAPHNCGGPVLHAVCTHICYNIPNLCYETYYSEIVTNAPLVVNGYIKPPQEPGLGVELRPEVFSRSDLVYRVTERVSTSGEKQVYNISGDGDPWKTNR